MQIADLLFGRFRGSSSLKENFIVLQKRDVKHKATWQQDKATTISIMAVVCTDTTHLSNSAQLDLTATDAVLTGLPLNHRQLFLLYLWINTVGWQYIWVKSTQRGLTIHAIFPLSFGFLTIHSVPWHNLDWGFAPYARNALICSLLWFCC